MRGLAHRAHLLIISTNYLETLGGVEGHIKQLAPLLVKRGIEVTVAYLGAKPATFIDENGVRVVCLRRRLDFRNIIALPDPADWRAFTKAVRDGTLSDRPVTHISTQTRFFPLSLLGVRLGRSLRLPVIHTEHGGGFVATNSAIVEAGAKFADFVIGRPTLRGADKVLAVSRGSADFVHSLAGVDARVFHNGVTLADWLPTTPIGPDRPRDLVFVGRLVAEKGWATFLEATAFARAQGWQGRAVVLGDGPDHSAVLTRAAELGLDVDAPGRVAPPQVRDALTGNVLVNSTVASEGFQLTLVEALAAGAAIVTTAVGGSDEIAAIKGADVTVVPKGDVEALKQAVVAAVDRAPTSPDRTTLEAWDWAAVSDAYANVMEALEGPGQ